MAKSKNLNVEVVSAATGLLQPMFPELGPKELISTLEQHYNSEPELELRKMLSIKEYCRRIGCSKPTAFRHIKEGKVNAVKIGGLTRISETELQKLMKTGCL